MELTNTYGKIIDSLILLWAHKNSQTVKQSIF